MSMNRPDENDRRDSEEDTRREAALIFKKRTSLPKLQLGLVFLVQFAEPVTAEIIYPFIKQFVESTGVTGGDEKRAGYYSGLIESVFFLTESLTTIIWPILSDRFGRRPILIVGPFGLALSILGFGLTKVFWPLLVFRALQGIFNGDISVSRTVLTELTNPVNRASVFACIPVIWTAGTATAAFLGGTLANPQTNFPGSLGKISVLQSHPYFLPCAAAACIAVLSFLLSLFGLKETHPAIIEKKKRKQLSEASLHTSLIASSNGNGYGAVSETRRSTDDDDERRPSLFALLIERQVAISLLNYGFLSFLEMAVVALIPLVYSTSIENGGLGFEPSHLGWTLGIYGVTNCCVQLFLTGRVIRFFGPKKIHVAAFFCTLVVFAMFPVMNVLARQSGKIDAKVWVIIVIQLANCWAMYTAFACSMLYVVDSAPSHGALGAVNGLGQTVAAIARGLAPASATSLFAISIEKDLVGGYMAFLIMCLVSLIAIWVSFLLPTHLKNNH